jgi:hypothetical protein
MSKLDTPEADLLRISHKHR